MYAVFLYYIIRIYRNHHYTYLPTIPWIRAGTFETDFIIRVQSTARIGNRRDREPCRWWENKIENCAIDIAADTAAVVETAAALLNPLRRRPIDAAVHNIHETRGDTERDDKAPRRAAFHWSEQTRPGFSFITSIGGIILYTHTHTHDTRNT